MTDVAALAAELATASPADIVARALQDFGDACAIAFSGAEDVAVIEYARQVALSNMQGQMTPELFASLRAHFSEAEILELGTAMAVISGMAKLSFVLDLVEREPYCPFQFAAA